MIFSKDRLTLLVLFMGRLNTILFMIYNKKRIRILYPEHENEKEAVT